MPNTSTQLKAQNDFDRFLAQTKSLLLAISSSDELEQHIINNALWLALDRLDDIESAYELLIEEMKSC